MVSLLVKILVLALDSLLEVFLPFHCLSPIYFTQICKINLPKHSLCLEPLCSKSLIVLHSWQNNLLTHRMKDWLWVNYPQGMCSAHQSCEIQFCMCVYSVTGLHWNTSKGTKLYAYSVYTLFCYLDCPPTC